MRDLALVGILAGVQLHAQDTTRVVSGVISYAGQRDTYTFSVATPARYYFDSLVNANGLQWSLSGPPGMMVASRSFTSSDAQTVGDPTVMLPVGDYTITVQGPGAFTNAYAFRFIDMNQAAPLTPGTTVSAALSPANKTDLYKFGATAGDQFYFHQIFRVGLQNTYWRLFDPYGNQIFTSGFYDVGTAAAPVSLPATGQYVLAIEGYVGDTGSGTYSFNVLPEGNVPPPTFTGTSMNIGDLMTGDFVANTTNAYVFTLANAATLVFDTQQDCPLNWTLQGPSGVVVNQRPFNASDGGNVQPTLQLPAGSYQLRVTGNSSSAYKFRLVDLASATPITLGTPVGASLSPANATLAYKFTITDPKRVFFNYLGSSGLGYPTWKLVNPYGSFLFSAGLGSDQGPITLTAPGTYVLLVEGYVYEAGNGSFQFAVAEVGDTTQTLSIGTTISGSITNPGQQRSYTFTLAADTRLYFDSLVNNGNLLWSLDGPTGNVVNRRSFNASDAQSIGYPILALPAGNYTLLVVGNGDTTADYQFRLLDLAAAAPLTLGTQVNGSLNPGNATLIYQFTINTAQEVFYNFQNWTGLSYTYARLLDPFGNVVMASNFGSDQGPFMLNQPGTYTFLVEGYIGDAGNGSFAFTIVPVTDGSQALTLGSTVNGTLQVAGQVQRYTFNLAAAGKLYFDALSSNGNLLWSLDGPKGNIVSRRAFNASDAQSIGYPVLALPAGSYTLSVLGSGDTATDFQFRLLDLASATSLPLGTALNSPLNPANSTLIYQFTVNSAQKVFYNFQASSGLNYTYLRLLDPFGNVVLANQLGSDQGPLMLSQTGTYTLLVEGYIGDSGNGNFALTVLPVTDVSQPLAVGSLVNGTVQAPGQSQVYTFNLASDSKLYFDAQSNNGNLLWSLDGPRGNVVNRRPFNGSDAQSVGYPILALTAGSYALTVVGNGDSTGDYQFRLLDLAGATPLTLGTQVNATLTPANSTLLYQFNVGSAQKVFYNFQNFSGLNYTYARLLDPFGNVVIAGNVTSDQGPIILNQTGTYTFLIEGYIGDAGSGNCSFTMVPVTDGTQALTFGALNSGVISIPGQKQLYTFNLSGGERLFFDSLTNTCSLNWRLDGPLGNVFGGNNTYCFSSDWLQTAQTPILAPGAYTITVAGAGDPVGGYAFRLFDLRDSPALDLSFTNGPTPPPPVVLLSAGWPVTGPITPGASFALSLAADSVGPITNLVFTATGALTTNQSFTDGGPYALIYPLSASASPGTTVQCSAYAVDSLNRTSLVASLTLTVGSSVAQQQPVIYYSRFGNPDGQIWARALDGSFDVPLVVGELPRVSPDGRYLAYHKGNPEYARSSLYLLDLRSGTSRLFIPNTDFIVGYDWATNSTQLFFDQGCEIDTINADGSGRRLVLNAHCYDDAPSINPVSGKLVFHNVAVGGGLLVANNDGTSRQLVPNTYVGCVYPAWSPDGQWIAYQDGTNFFKIHPDGTGLTALTAAPLATDSFKVPGVWVADGSRLLTAGTYNGVNGLYQIMTDGTKAVTRLDTAAGAAIDSVGSIISLPGGSVPFVGTAPPRTSTISTNVTPANGSVAWRIAALGGQQLLLKPVLQTGFNVQSAPRWLLRDPLGNVLFDNWFTDPGEIQTSIPGDYNLVVYGWNTETATSGSVTIQAQLLGNATISPVGGIPLTFGNIASGNVSSAQPVVYSFSLATAKRLMFDSRTFNDQVKWSLSRNGLVFVNNRSFAASDYWDISDASLALLPGDYLLTISSPSGSSQPYAFQLLDFNAATSFTPGTVVFGSLAPASGTVLQKFSGTAGDRYFFDGQQSSGFASTPYCRLYSPAGSLLWSAYINASVDTFPLPETGTYVLSVEGRANDPGLNGSYAFNLLPANPTTNSLTIGNTISGTLATKGLADYYTFTLPVDSTLYFDALTRVDFYWRLDTTWGQAINWRSFGGSDSQEIGDPALHLPAGNYVLTVAGNNFRVTGDYKFRLLNFTNATPFTPGTAVVNTLNPAIGTVFYKFSGNAGDKYFYEGQQASGFAYAPYARVYSPYGDIVAGANLNGYANTFTLPVNGTYTVTVEGRIYETQSSGAYAFNLIPVTYTTNALAIGDTVTASLPTKGLARYYTFTLPIDSTLYFDALTRADFYWRLDATWGQAVNWRSVNGSDSLEIPDPALHLPAGNYVLTLAGNNYQVTGDCKFRLLNFTNATAFAPGTLVLGTLDPAIGTVFYKFNGSAGANYFFDGQQVSGFDYAPYVRFYSPLGDIIAAANVNGSVNTFPLPVSGTYTVAVEGRIYETKSTGNYAFNLIPINYQTNALTVGNTVSGTLATKGLVNSYTFTLPVDSTLYFDALTRGNFSWRLDALWGQAVNWRSFGSSDSQEIADPALRLPAGNYVLTVAGDNYQNTGDYQFRLLNFTNSTLFTPGTVVSGTLNPAIGTVFYKFNANAGDRFYFDGLQASGFDYAPYCRIYAPAENGVVGQTVNSDVDTFTMLQTGTYTLTVEGRIYETKPSGTYAFNLVPNPPLNPKPLYNTNLAPDVTLSAPIVSGNQVSFSFGTAANHTYTVQYSTGLEPPILWQTFTSVIGNNTVFTVTDNIAATGNRFYRVQVQ